MKRFSFVERKENLHKLQFEEFDLLIIGGGINGAGVARDASMRGMKVALVEAKDFASGTSSKSSKLIHGGIRYLENLDFHLVFEALSERTKLFSMAPHLVHPLRFMIPLYKSSRVGMFKMGLGMWLYDALSLFRAPELHERLNEEETLVRMPPIEKSNLVGSYIYSDAYMDDDRLVLETLRSANEHDACCVNYVKAGFVRINSSSANLYDVELEDQLSGGKFFVKAKHIVSSVGPWTDELGQKVQKSWKKILRPTKGIHLTLEKKRLPLESAVVMAAEKGNRIVFAIPRHEMVIIGTTDTDYRETPDAVSTTSDDVKYLLQITGQYFPGANISAKDIIASYAGVRPLVQDGASSEGKTSREHSIFTISELPITFVVGGKYTTYRLMSEQVVNEVLNHFSIEDRVQFGKSKTDVALNQFTDVESYQQAINMHSQWANEFQVEEKISYMLAARHGMEAAEIIKKFSKLGNVWQMEAAQAIENTMCLSPLDFYLRRVHLFLAEANHGVEYLEGICQVFADYFSLSAKDIDEHRKIFGQFIETELHWKKDLLH